MGRQVAIALLRNRPLSRMVLAFACFNLADWARWLAILVYAFERGGAAEAGIVSLLQLVPAAIVAPLAANLGDRFSRTRMLQAAYWSQAAALAATGLALVAGAPGPLVYALAVLAVIATSLMRPAHASLLPSVTREPAELTAANAASGWMEGLGILLGPAVAGVILAVSTPGSVYLLATALMALGGALVITLPAQGVASQGAPSNGAASTGARSKGGQSTGLEPNAVGRSVRELFAGFEALRSLPGPRVIVLVLGAAAALWGAVDVLSVVLAIDVMGLGPGGAGLFGVALGVGGLVGSSLAASLIGRPRLAPAFIAGLLLWGAPLLGIALAPVPWVAVALLVAGGAGRSLMDVAGRTLLQRAAPDAVLSRIFGIVEGAYLGAFGLGSIAIAGVIGLLGPIQALVVAGLWLPVVTVLGWGRLRMIDGAAVVPFDRINLLRAIPMFAPLPPPTIERLARQLIPVTFGSGSTVIRQGDPGDRFYIVESGTVEFSIDGRVIGPGEPGDSFGEIALLRDVPRTASVVATTDVLLWALEQAPFLEALTGHRSARVAADQIVAERLAS